MEIEKKLNFDWVESSVLEGVDVDFTKTFCRDLSDSGLQISMFGGSISDSEKDWPRRSVGTKLISNLAELQPLAEQTDLCQVFCIRQKNSYQRLYITKELFEQLLRTYSVFPRIWDFVVPFSFKTRESDISHAPFRFRQLEPVVFDNLDLGSFECAYGFRYVVLNHRKEAMEYNPDYDPWSIRQTAVYQQFNRQKARNMFVLITPAETSRKRLEDAVNACEEDNKRLNPFDLHRILISSLHENWRLYIRGIEKILKEQSDRVTLTQVQNETENLSPLANFPINFIDRQRLKIIEDKILDLIIIFESLYNTVAKLQRQCRLHCLGSRCVDCICVNIIEEFEEQMHEAQINMKKADILYKRAQGTAQLLSDLLDYENAQIANHNEKSLNELAKESKEENSKMRILTERSTKDATAVKILTVITLIYLPVTVVASIFSSQLIHVDDNGRISVISESWWFVVVALPLTVFTFFLWRYWLSYSMKEQNRKANELLKPELQKLELHRFRPLVKNGTFAQISRGWSVLRNRGGGSDPGALA